MKVFMEYRKYLKIAKDFLIGLNLTQRFFLAALLLLSLAGGIYLANPAKKLLEMRNSQRRSDVVNILNAVYQYRIDNKNVLPASISSTPTSICRSGGSSCTGMVDLSDVFVREKKMLSKMPIDPREKNQDLSGYQISLSSNGRINVTAPLAENNAVISLSK
jgi:hypothetical protein